MTSSRSNWKKKILSIKDFPSLLACQKKTPIFRDAITKITSEDRLQKCYADDVLSATQIWVMLLISRAERKFASTNQTHYPDLGSDTSSVWNFFSRYSVVISRENHW